MLPLPAKPYASLPSRSRRSMPSATDLSLTTSDPPYLRGVSHVFSSGFLDFPPGSNPITLEREVVRFRHECLFLFAWFSSFTEEADGAGYHLGGVPLLPTLVFP